MGDDSVPLRELLNKSGIPFQLAIETLIRGYETKTGVRVIGTEVPWAKGFIDIVASTSDRMFFGIECKKVDDKAWIFVCGNGARQAETRCRIEWFNGRAGMHEGQSRVFCEEWNMVEPSIESQYCIVPKGTPIASLEAVCNEVLASCHDILDNEKNIHRDNDFAAMVPVIVTNAKLYSCTFNPQQVIHRSGELDPNDGQFNCVDMVRFRKSLSNQGSNPYSNTPMDLSQWTAERDRTVFVVNPSALGRFFNGFRSFMPAGYQPAPAHFINPPQ